MKKEHKSELIQDALEFLDEDMIEDVDQLRRATRKEKKHPWRRWTALAASICVLCIGSWVWEQSQKIEHPEISMEETKGNQTMGDEGVKEEAAPEDNIPEGSPETLPGPDIEPGLTKPGTTPPESTEEPVILGDIYQLKGNCAKVWVMSHEAWEALDDSKAVTEVAVAVESEYMADMEQLIDAMCEAGCVKTEKLPSSEPYMIYHIFFEKEDGALIHCWLLEDGYLYYHDKSDISLQLNRAIYGTTFKILSLYM